MRYSCRLSAKNLLKLGLFEVNLSFSIFHVDVEDIFLSRLFLVHELIVREYHRVNTVVSCHWHLHLMFVRDMNMLRVDDWILVRLLHLLLWEPEKMKNKGRTQSSNIEKKRKPRSKTWQWTVSFTRRYRRRYWIKSTGFTNEWDNCWKRERYLLENRKKTREYNSFIPLCENIRTWDIYVSLGQDRDWFEFVRQKLDFHLEGKKKLALNQSKDDEECSNLIQWRPLHRDLQYNHSYEM